MKRGTPSPRKARERLKQKGPKSIVIYGAPIHCSTGNSKLIFNMALAFKEAGHKVYTIGLDYNGPQMWYKNIPVMPSFHCEVCGNAHKGSIRNIQKIADTINLLNSSTGKAMDYLICVGDPYQMQQMGMGNLEMKQTKMLMYATIDSEGIFCNEGETTSEKDDYLIKCDRIISTAKFTQKQLKYWLDMDSDLIYETIDLKNYSPVDKGKRTELRKKHGLKEDDFVIYNSGRNIMRKRIFMLIDGCAKFLCEHENAYMLINCPLHAGTLYPDTLNPKDFIKKVMKKKYGRDLLEEGKIIFIERGELGSKSIGEKENAELYQIADVYATATGGEGFGLSPVESLACGIPAIVPDNSTGAETIGATKEAGEGEDKPTEAGFRFSKGGLLMNAPYEVYVDWGLLQRWTPPEIIYNSLNFLYNDPELIKRLGESGRKHVEELFDFETFRRKWIKIIETTDKKKEEKEVEKESFKEIKLKSNKSKKVVSE